MKDPMKFIPSLPKIVPGVGWGRLGVGCSVSCRDGVGWDGVVYVMQGCGGVGGVGHAGVGWVMLGWGRVGHVGVGVGHAGVWWGGGVSCTGGVGHVEVGWSGSCRGGVGWGGSCRVRWVM